MKAFLARHAPKIIGVLSGFDRLVFRGTLRQISYVAGLFKYLCFRRILLKEFTGYAEKITAEIRRSSEELAQDAGRPFRYLHSSDISKEEVALGLLRAHPVKEGLICVLSCVELCQSFEIHRSREKKKLELQSRQRKCLHLYHYFLDPDFGLFHVRLQTWFPFTVQVCMNGRHWLANQMDRRGIQYEQRDNCFASIDDFAAAQSLMTGLLKTNWARTLDRIVHRVHPTHRKVFTGSIMPYYWSVGQSEWATDVCFESSASLNRIYRPLVLHAISQLASPDVMRFLGQRVSPRFQGEIVSDFKDRPEGVRVKHRVNQNSIKVYDKQGSVLRVETTINRPQGLKTYRRPEGHPEKQAAWLPVRRGIADLHRLGKLSDDSNKRYLDALAVVEDSTELQELTKTICRPIVEKNRRYRALRPWEESEAKLLQAIQRGEFVVTGFRNRDIRSILFGRQASARATDHKNSAKVGRLLRLLRAHDIVKKIHKTNRYQVTQEGRKIITAILAARSASVEKLVKSSA